MGLRDLQAAEAGLKQYLAETEVESSGALSNVKAKPKWTKSTGEEHRNESLNR